MALLPIVISRLFSFGRKARQHYWLIMRPGIYEERGHEGVDLDTERANIGSNNINEIMKFQ